MTNKEAEWLLQEKYNGVESAEYHADLKRLEAGEPVAYVIGFSKFLGCTIDLSQRTLIPRVETEYWVEKAIAELPKDMSLTCLDVFSGSGCIGVAVLSKLPQVTMDFVDIEDSAIEQIQINTKLNQIDESRYHVYKSDVFAGLPEGNVYDMIFANPPYIADKKDVDTSVLEHEPHTALFSPQDGLFHIQKTLEGAQTRLNEGGVLYLEFDDSQKEMLEMMLQNTIFSHKEFYKDQFGRWRWFVARK